MAIVLDVIGSNGGELHLPPVFVKHVAAAGNVDLDADCESLFINNLSTSQTVSIRLNADSDNTAASPTEGKSFRLDAGQSVTALLPPGSDATAYKLNIA